MLTKAFQDIGSLHNFNGYKSMKKYPMWDINKNKVVPYRSNIYEVEDESHPNYNNLVFDVESSLIRLYRLMYFLRSKGRERVVNPSDKYFNDNRIRDAYCDVPETWSMSFPRCSTLGESSNLIQQIVESMGKLTDMQDTIDHPDENPTMKIFGTRLTRTYVKEKDQSADRVPQAGLVPETHYESFANVKDKIDWKNLDIYVTKDSKYTGVINIREKQGKVSHISDAIFDSSATVTGNYYTKNNGTRIATATFDKPKTTINNRYLLITCARNADTSIRNVVKVNNVISYDNNLFICTGLIFHHGGHFTSAFRDNNSWLYYEDNAIRKDIIKGTHDETINDCVIEAHPNVYGQKINKCWTVALYRRINQNILSITLAFNGIISSKYEILPNGMTQLLPGGLEAGIATRDIEKFKTLVNNPNNLINVLHTDDDISNKVKSICMKNAYNIDNYPGVDPELKPERINYVKMDIDDIPDNKKVSKVVDYLYRLDTSIYIDVSPHILNECIMAITIGYLDIKLVYYLPKHEKFIVIDTKNTTMLNTIIPEDILPDASDDDIFKAYLCRKDDGTDGDHNGIKIVTDISEILE
jgi:hypothetical protein